MNNKIVHFILLDMPKRVFLAQAFTVNGKNVERKKNLKLGKYVIVWDHNCYSPCQQ